MTAYNPYSVAPGIEGRQLPSGTDKKGKIYGRSLSFQPGYKDLVNIVAGLQKDVKKINQCLTLEGAQAYVNAVDKNGNRIRNNWTAHEEDITGPNGKPDGIKEVFVADAKGNLKVINGYGLEKTDYPLRKAYRTLYKTKEERKQHPFDEFKDALFQVHGGWDQEGRPYYERDPGQISPEFKFIQPNITPKKLYKDFLFKPMYNAFKPSLKEGGVQPMQMAQIFNYALADCYNRHIKYPVLSHLLGGVDPDEVETKIVNKVLRSDQYAADTQDLIKRILDSADVTSHVQSEIHEVLGGVADEVIGGNIRTPQRERGTPGHPRPGMEGTIPQTPVAFGSR